MRIDFVDGRYRESLVETWYDCQFIPKLEDIVFVGGKYYQVSRRVWLGRNQVMCMIGETEYTRSLK